MISTEIIDLLKDEINEAIEESFDLARETESNKNDFLLFLESCHLPTDKSQTPVLGPGSESINDNSRLKFLQNYISFKTSRELNQISSNQKSDFKDFSLHLELMIYSHCWESIPNIKELKRLVDLIEGNDYDFNLEIPIHTKQKYIRSQIKNPLVKKNLKLGDIISKSFHSQIRNAFAHSDYNIRFEKIILLNYTGEPWQLEYLSFDDFELMNTYTMLLFLLFEYNKEKYKYNIGSKEPTTDVYMPNYVLPTTFKKMEITYFENSNRFIFSQNNNR